MSPGRTAGESQTASITDPLPFTVLGKFFFPTRGVLAWYSRQDHTLKPLPGADDADYVHTSAFWSPDGGCSFVFSRAKAKDPFAPGQPAG